jgi:hypothetical protein
VPVITPAQVPTAVVGNTHTRTLSASVRGRGPGNTPNGSRRSSPGPRGRVGSSRSGTPPVRVPAERMRTRSMDL